MPALALPASMIVIAEALLIGFLIGAIGGLLQNPWLTAASLLSVTAMLGAFYFQVQPRTGITTEMAALATYCLGFLAASPAVKYGESLAIGLAIVVVAFLEAKRTLHKLVRETITEAEFDDTLRFLAIIFIVYPILPAGEFGPYGFLAPRKIWLFVILVSSVSYAGYFLAKFLGARRGVKLAGILGGLASTTAATMAFAGRSSEEPENRPLYSQATILANSIQFPRVLLILLMVSPALAVASLIPLLVMTAAGLAAGLLLGRAKGMAADAEPLGLRNPFRLLPAMKFGVLFGAILFASKAGAAWFGGQAIYWTSGLAGSLDADAVALSLADLLARGSVPVKVGVACILLALLANAVVKTGIAFYAGTPSFARRVAAGFVVMYGAGAVAWWLGG